MATSLRGRSSSRSGSTPRGYSFFGSNWGNSSPFGQSNLGRSTTSTKRTTKAKKSSNGAKTGSTGYKSVSTQFENKISSYRTLIDQTKGAAKYPRPTPAILNSFANWVNRGAIVQQVSPSQLSRWAKTTSYGSFSTRNPSTTACKTVLCKKFGKTTIKAVTRSKNGWFLVATSSTHKGRAFSFPR